MKSTTVSTLTGIALALLLVAAAPAAASADLQLGVAREAQESALGLAPDPAEEAAGEEGASIEIRPSEIRAEAWALQGSSDDPGDQMKPEKKRGFGRWLKRHWYVPVLAAVVLGVALDDDDNDRAGEED